jgi:hypothetical protein
MGVTAGIFLASILLKETRYLVYIGYLYGFLPQEKLTWWVRINTVKKLISQLL